MPVTNLRSQLINHFVNIKIFSDKMKDYHIHQISFRYRNKNFRMIIKESNNEFTIQNINHEREFTVDTKKSSKPIVSPIIGFETSTKLNIQTFEIFNFNIDMIKKTCDKMLDTKIIFKEV